MNQSIDYIYRPPQGKNSFSLAHYYDPSMVRCYSLARYALRDALRLCGVGPGDVVLIPAFICRDLLAPIHTVGAEVRFYDVREDLSLSSDPLALPKAKAIVAVNFFGMPQDLAPFRKYCQAHGAFLIEDNAHGLLGRDPQGALLGTRGDLGLLSARKSLPMPSGGALLVNRQDLKTQAQEWPQTSHDPVVPLGFKAKDALRSLTPLWGGRGWQFATKAVRTARKAIKGHAIPVEDTDSENLIPGPETGADIDFYASRVDLPEEIKRRRELFDLLLRATARWPIRPLWTSLPEGTVPYVFPFYCEEAEVPGIKRHLASLGLECFNWPALPTAVLAADHPARYGQVWAVRFMW